MTKFGRLAALALALTFALAGCTTATTTATSHTVTLPPVVFPHASPPPLPTTDPFALQPASLTAVPKNATSYLPAAVWDAVLPQLQGLHVTSIDASSVLTDFKLKAPVVLYEPGAQGVMTPRAYLPKVNFRGRPTVVLGYGAPKAGWQMVLTPARPGWPSQSQLGAAGAQSMAYARVSDLPPGTPREHYIYVDRKALTVSLRTLAGAVLQSRSAGVGKPSTKTPSGLGYVQETFSDPRQSAERIVMTSLFSTAADRVYEGNGSQLALHFTWQHTGAISHGCIRLGWATAAQLLAVPRLVGMPILVGG